MQGHIQLGEVTGGMPNPVSAWRKTAESNVVFPVLSGDARTDVAIIGAGLTGLSTARDLMSRGVECMVLEARDVAWGASGRTGGFIVPRFKNGFVAIARQYGNEVAKACFANVLHAVDSVAETVEQFSLRCGFQRKGHLTPAHSDKALSALRADAEWLARYAGDSRPKILAFEETREAIGTEVYRGSYFDPRGACMNAYDYVRGLGAALMSRGVPIVIQAEVQEIQSDGNGWLLKTASGSVRARRVVLATNAYTRPLWPGDDLNRRIVPVASSVISTRPLTSSEKETVVPSGLPVTDTKRILNYFRVLPNGQLIFGGRGDITGRRSDPAVYNFLERQLAQTFPQIAGIEIAERWFGMVAVTLDDFPHIGTLGNGIYYALGYGGRGVALTSLMGRFMAAWLCGEKIEPGPMSSTGLTRIPFHSLRIPAMRAMAFYYRLRDKLEH